MKLVTGIVTSLVIGSLSFGAFAAKELEKDKVAGMNLTTVGEISTSDTTAPMDARAELSKKADELGGTYYVVTSAEKQTKNVRATADVYK
ncbi:YdgH/BhsA/McbA-like domain containing protein [Enterobacter sp. WI-ESBL-E8]